MKQKQKGFTLIELLVVIVIIGILATISVGTFNGYFKRSRDAKRFSEISQAEKVIRLKSLETGSVLFRKGCLGTHDEIYSTTKCIINVLNESGIRLPSIENDCYIFAKEMYDNSKFLIFSSQQYLDNVLVFHGNSILKNNISSDPNDGYKYLNFQRLHNYIRYYKNHGCQKTHSSWNGLALNLGDSVTPYPSGKNYIDYILFNTLPLDPIYQN